MSGEKLSADRQAVAVWAALQAAGAPADEWIPRADWNNALRVTLNVSSQPSLRDRTRAAKEMGLIEVDRGHRGKEGKVRLLAPGSEGQVLIGVDAEDVEALISDAVEA